MALSHTKTRSARDTLGALAVGALLAPSTFAGLSVVDASGGGDFTQIQAAVDAAVDGDSILVRAGSYAPFTIDGKSLWVVAQKDVSVTVTDTVTVKNVAAGDSVVLYGFTVNAATAMSGSVQHPGLAITDNVGHVRAQLCTFNGALGANFYSTLGNGGSGADVSNSLSVAFERCTFRGGKAKSACDDFFYICGSPYDRGGHGVSTALSLAAFYDCTLQGGDAGMTEYYGPSGNGGNGCDVPSFGIFASGSRFIGGRGGFADDYLPATGGNGGHGVRVENGAQAQLLDNTYTGGPSGGSFVGAPGSPGAATSGAGNVHLLSGNKRLCFSDVLVASGDTVPITLVGQPGDRFYLPFARTSNWHYWPPKLGVWLVPLPVKLPHTPIGVIPPSGSIEVQVPMPDLASTESLRQAFAQAFVVTSGGQVVLGSPLHLLVEN